MNEDQLHQRVRTKLLPAAVGAWVGYAATDFLMHGVFLASWWRTTERYWLPPGELFRMIPLSYAAFAIYCSAIVWLLARLYDERVGPRAGLGLGAITGVVLGALSVLTGYCVFPMPRSALVVWPASLTVETTIAGGVAGWILVAGRPWRRAVLVFGLGVVLVAVGVVIQNLLLATPADRLVE